MFNKFIYLILGVTLSTTLFSQNASWNYRVNSGDLGEKYDWIDCSNDTELDRNALSVGNLDDGRWDVNWPFNFKIYDDNYTTSDNLSISTNGFIRFDDKADHRNWNRARDYVLDAIPSVNFGQILCYGITDGSFSAANSHVYTKLSGNAPDRVFTIEFNDMGFYWAANMYADIQVSFYETSNIIAIKVGDNNVTYEGAEIGLHSRVSPYFHYWQDIDNAAKFSWIEYIPASATSYNNNSYAVPAASQPAITEFPSNAIASGTAHDVLNFRIVDAGNDGVPTKVSKIRIKNAYPSNSADWSDCIAGVVLNDGTKDLNVGITTIDDNYIDFLFNIDEFDVPDGATVDLTLKIYLNPGTIVEGKTLQFYIDDDNHGWYHDQMGSGFKSDFGNSSDIASNIFTFVITASRLVFSVNPPEVIHQNYDISAVIKVEAQDESGTVDPDFNGEITLSNSAGLTMSGFTASLINGVATFPGLQFSQTGGPITLSTVNNYDLIEGTSTETTVAILNVLFADDFENPSKSLSDWSISGTSGTWEVGNQTNDSWGPASGHSANGVFATVLNERYNNDVDAYLESPVIDLAGSADPKIKFWMDMESESGNDGGTVQIRVKPNESSPWGSYITIDMSDAGYSGNIPNDTDVDGLDNNVDGWSGNSPAGEWAEVQIDLFNLNTAGLNAITASSLIQVRFWFGSSHTSRNFGGWYIDDFEISYTSFPGLWSTSASSTDWNTGSNWDDGAVPNGIHVTIPSGALNYPEVDETANASNIFIRDGGALKIIENGNLNLSRDLTLGEGNSGIFEINNGSCQIEGNLYTKKGTITNFNGGNTQFTNWIKNSSEESAEGNITLSSGTITAFGNVDFASSNLVGIMTGDFILNIQGNLKISDNVWANPTGGTINIAGELPAILESQAGNGIKLYNLKLSNVGGVTLNSTASILNNVDVFEKTFLTVPSGFNLSVSGDFTLHATDKERAYLIDNENITVNGKSIVKFHTSANAYQYISSPVSEASKKIFTIAPWGAVNYNFYKYNEANTNPNTAYGWVRPTENNLAVGLGYAYYMTKELIHNVTGGHFNTGNITIPVYNSGTNPSNSWNLIGNPYPSSIDANTFIRANSSEDPSAGLITGTLYFWDDDGSDGSDYSSADYATYNRAGAIGGGNGKTVNGFIPIGQAFFVQANANGNVSFTNSMRSSTPGRFFKSSNQSKELNKNILLSVTNSANDYNETLIAFIDNATNEYDNMYDGIKMFGNSKLSFYSMMGDQALAIQSLAQVDANIDTLVIIPLGVKIGVNGSHKLRLNKTEKIDAAYSIFIKDNLLDTLVELSTDSIYEFSANTGTFNNRFSLILKSTYEEEGNIYEEIPVVEIIESNDSTNVIGTEDNTTTDVNDNNTTDVNDNNTTDADNNENNNDTNSDNDSNDVTDIKLVNTDDISVYAVKSSLYIIVDSELHNEASNLTIYDISGRIVLHANLVLNKKNELPLNLDTGFYFVQLYNNQMKPVYKKIVIER